MLDVKNICCCFMCVLVGLTTVESLINLKFFYVGICCSSNQKVLFLPINDAMASSPHGGAVIDS